jgi:quercetin dioxygenase-like cupin family protein
VITEKAWGHERLIHNGSYCMKLLVYTKRVASSLHYHVTKHESFYVASGKYLLENDLGRTQMLNPGDAVVLGPGMHHRIRCLEPGTIVEASTHDDPNDCVRLIPSET